MQDQIRAENAPDSDVVQAITNPDMVSAENAEVIEKLSYREIALSVLKNLPSEGFERFCQYLLRRSGFEEVIVTGSPGDGGIDGIGDLVVNPFVKFKIAFQCKRYRDSVGPEVIRNFRGSIMGRADKGIIMTTGVFTSDARKEARRDGAIPIELVDGDKMLTLMELLEVGLKSQQITVYNMDSDFFEQFR